MQATRQAVVYVTHGGGPMPLLGETGHAKVTSFLKNVSKVLPVRPKAILCFTAHWEEKVTTVSTSPSPSMLYDYYGFPPESYKFQYPAPGSPELAGKVMDLLRSAGVEVAADAKRGYDHGTFVPLMLMFPEADIPVVQVSLMSSMDPGQHIKVGQALSVLRDDNVLILGSGSSFHNMQGLFGARSGTVDNKAKIFNDWLVSSCTKVSPDERLSLLSSWAQAPAAKNAHPREEHLIPLMVAAGAAGQDGGTAHCQDMWGLPVASFVFGQQK